MFLKKLFDLIPQDPLSKGLAQFNQGQLDEAIGAFESLFEHPDAEIRKKARLFACEAHLQLGDGARHRDPEAALPHYQAAAELQPGFADVQNKLGETQRHLGHEDSARDCFEAALEINARYLTARLNLAQSLARLGDCEGAAGELDRILQDRSPYFHDLLEALRADLREAKNGPWDDRFEELRGLAPSRSEARRQEALGALQGGDPERAIEIVDALLSENPSWPDLYLLRGLALGELQRPEEAVVCFQDALQRHPHYLKARINLGVTYLELGRVDEARDELERALDTDPDNALARAALAEIETAPLSS